MKKKLEEKVKGEYEQGIEMMRKKLMEAEKM